MSNVLLERVTKTFGKVVALKELDLEIKEGEFLTLLGPSGCGKTTTLRLIAGFIEPTAGKIYLDGDDVTAMPPQHREIGMVFQDYALFPHLTVYDNIGFGLRERGASKREIESRVKELLDLVLLPGVEDRYPAELSGGQAQRIAVARAVAYPPRVLLMDEPLGALDLKLRETMQIELRRIQQELQITTVFVTHDQVEAMAMSDRIVVMNQGVVEQIGTAETIYNSPATKFIADFVGQINLLDGTLLETANGCTTVRISTGDVIQAPAWQGGAAGNLSLALRPEHLAIADTVANGMNAVSGTITDKSFSGNLVRLFVDIGGEKPLVVEDRPDNLSAEIGDRVNVVWQPHHSKLLGK